MVFEGKEVISYGRKMIGATNPLASDPSTIRGAYGVDLVMPATLAPEARAAVRAVPSVEDAVEAANDTVFGLGATLFTADLDLAARVAGLLECGAVFVNDMVRSDPRMPFGGTKQSGWGRELGREGMQQFTHTRSVWIA